MIRQDPDDKKLGRIILIMIFLGFLLYITVSQISKFTQKKQFNPVDESFPEAEVLGTEAETLESLVAETLAKAEGKYGVVIRNLKTGETYTHNPQRPFQPGSLYKLWVMGETFQQLQQGKLHDEDVLTEKISVLNDKFKISSEAAELTEGEATFTVAKAVQQMITISHNYAALLLTQKLRLSAVKNFLAREELTHSMVGLPTGSPSTTPADIALFYEKLYQGKLANKIYTNRMFDLLKKQQLNGKLPKYLPELTSIAHKTGELDGFSHDAGIVFTPSGDYIIVMMSETKKPDIADENIAEVSKKVYEYFNEKNK